MVRSYDASRRQKAAERTRREILRAALKLHWEGVTEFESIAREAGCSAATVRKHFSTKEALYRNCTQAFAETLVLPDLEVLAKIRKPEERRRQCIGDLCRIHESMFGYAWLGAYERRHSPTLDAVMREYEGLADAIAQIVAPKRSPKAPLVRGLLDQLTYRALRLSGDLSPEQIRDELVITVSALAGEQSGLSV
jgi:AcrR family transcriptional regulator